MFHTIETTGHVGADHTLRLKLPDDVPEGPCDVVLTVKRREAKKKIDWLMLPPLDLVMVDPNATFRREEMYGDDGR